jgi:UPF0755 protein
MKKRVKHYSYNSPRKKRLRNFFLVCGLVLVLLVLGTYYLRNLYTDNLKPVNGTDTNILVTIPTGSSLSTIADTLKQADAIKSAWSFEWYVRNDNFARTSLEAGTYVIHPDQTVQQIVTQLTEGKGPGDLVTILPGQRIDQIETALISDGFPKQEVISALSESQYVSKYPMLANLPQGATLEGFLYPDSFAKDTTSTASEIVNDSLSEMQSRLNLNIINSFNKQGLNIYQGVTLASMVEQEVPDAADQAKVAQVFLTRLHSGMDLGSDATAFYGAIVAGQKPSINYESVYNTRLNPGLPFGPISNVGEVSLEAVANPANTDYLYFVTGDNGITYYATTLAQHNQQVQQYCQKLCSSE